jgi:protein-disulfide isomerase
MKSVAGNKIVLIALLVLVAGAAWFGYSKQTENLQNPDDSAAQVAEKEVAEKAPAPDAAIFKIQKSDIVIGKADAPITIIDYSSLSCPHCGHFHSQVLPALQKQYIDTGKAKLVYRHFPLNAPALRAAQLVNCAAPGQRQNFLKVLFDMQPQWAFTEGFIAQLKQIASVGGIDSAEFDSCLADKTGESKIIDVRKRAAEEAQVNATPTFFINGVKMTEAPELDSFKDALAKAGAK